MNHAGLARTWILLTAVILLTGCLVGPDFSRPTPPEGGYTREPLAAATTESPVLGGAAQRFIEGMDIPGQWWTLFRSEPLNALIDEALRNNPDVQAAQAALRVAQEAVKAQQGVYFPAVTASFTPSRQRTPTAAVSPASASGSPTFTLVTAQVAVAYTLDVFGLNRRTVEGLQAQEEVQRFQVEATYLTLTTNLVAAAVQEAALRSQIAAVEEIITIGHALLESLQTQKALGRIPEADVAAQETAVAQAEASLPPLQKQLALQRDQLTSLLGRLPSGTPDVTFELTSLSLPPELPVSLPGELIEQRPDVRAAEATLHAASAQIGVAVANRLPNVTLTASGGTAANSFGQLFTPGTGLWSVAASLLQPVLDGGTLRHKERAARAAFDQAAAQYRSTIITACQNVADTLHALQTDAAAVQAAARAEQAAARSLAIARTQLALGAATYPTVLTAQQAYVQSRLALVQTQASRYADTAALFQALGGGWWHRVDVAPEPAESWLDRVLGP